MPPTIFTARNLSSTNSSPPSKLAKHLFAPLLTRPCQSKSPSPQGWCSSRSVRHRILLDSMHNLRLCIIHKSLSTNALRQYSLAKKYSACIIRHPTTSPLLCSLPPALNKSPPHLGPAQQNTPCRSKQLLPPLSASLCLCVSALNSKASRCLLRRYPSRSHCHDK